MKYPMKENILFLFIFIPNERSYTLTKKRNMLFIRHAKLSISLRI